VVHKENAAQGRSPNHREFHKLCLRATYQRTANSPELLGTLGTTVDDIVADLLDIPHAEEEPLLCYQVNSGQGAYVIHSDDPGDPYPQDNTFMGGGGGIGAAVANVTLRCGATVVFEVFDTGNDTGDNGPIAAVSFKVEPCSVWAMKAESLYLGAHGVLPHYLREACSKEPLDAKDCRISVNMRYGLMDMQHCQWFFSGAPGNEKFLEKFNECTCKPLVCTCAAALPAPECRTWKMCGY
jgi:hypothetical protein